MTWLDYILLAAKRLSMCAVVPVKWLFYVMGCSYKMCYYLSLNRWTAASGNMSLEHTGSWGVVGRQCLFHPGVLWQVRVLWDPVVDAGAHMLLAGCAAAPPTSLHNHAFTWMAAWVVLY